MTSLGLEDLRSADFGIGYFFSLWLGRKVDKHVWFAVLLFIRLCTSPIGGGVGKVVENIFVVLFI